MKRATAKDIEQLVALMDEFYAESNFRLNHQRATETFASLLADERMGCVWLLQKNSQAVGYVVATLCYSMEFGGQIAHVDDFFVRAPFRRAGLGSAALAAVRDFCAERGIRAIQVETGRDNVPAQAAYRRAGFTRVDRDLLTLQLAEATHDLQSKTNGK
jgi:ribosomal protein S18 acetylase RimI-like enzyme